MHTIEKTRLCAETSDFFEIILTRTDDQEFVAVARFASPDGVDACVEAGDKIPELWRNLVASSRVRAREEML